MAKLNSGTRIYGTANVDSQIYVGANVSIGTDSISVGNSTVNTQVTNTGVSVSGNILASNVYNSSTYSSNSYNTGVFLSNSYYSTLSSGTSNSYITAYIVSNNYLTNASIVYSGTQKFNANLIIANTAAVIANGVPGTAGQVLTSNGSIGSPAWVTPISTAKIYTYSLLFGRG